MFSVEAARADWTRHSRPRPLEPVMAITEAGLVLGGTVLAKIGRAAGGSPRLAIDGAEERILALLAAAYGKAVAPAVLDNIRRAATEWRRGETCLALIHLARSGLPRLGDVDKASFRLFLADNLLADGVSPRELIKACGLDPAPLDLLKAGYDPDQPRIPAGNGKESGEWTADDPPPPTPTAPVESGVQLIDFKIVHGLQPDSVVVTPPDGVPIQDEDSDSPTRKLIAPPPADFRKVYAAGQAIASLSLSQQQQRGHDAIAQGGTYDFQRDVPHQKFYDAYEQVSNYAVGVYMAGAGYSLPLTYLIAKYYALRHSSNYDAQDREHWIRRDWNDAKSGRWQ